MPKAKGKGGKNRRRGKNDEDLNKRELIFKEDGQEYAQVVKMLGNGRLEAKCQDGETRLGQIRGQMRKKIWIVGGDIILLSLREFQDGIADVIHKYTADEARNLKTYGELKADFQVNDADAGGEGSSDEEGGIEFEEAEIDDISPPTMSPWRTLPLNQPPFAPLQNPTDPIPSPDGLSVTLNTGHGSNYWRTPFPAPGRAPVTGGMWGFRRKVGREGFEVRCEVQVSPEASQQWMVLIGSDQAALLVQLSPTEWVKTGAEYVNGKMWHGAVVCNPFSDWSIMPLSTNRRFTISFDPSLTTLRVYLGSSSSSTRTSPDTSSPTLSSPPITGASTDSEQEDIMIREVKTFGLASAGLSYLIPGQVPADVDPAAKLADMEVMVGLMACSPLGQGEGPECCFTRFEMREGVRGVH